MRGLKILLQLSCIDRLTIIACLRFCATLDDKRRKEFQKEYGLKADNNITKLMEQLLS